MDEREAILRTERKALIDLGEFEEFLREHPDDDSAETAPLDKSLEHDLFLPLVWNQRNGKLVDGVKRRRRLLALGFTHVTVGVVDYDDATHLALMRAAQEHINRRSVTTELDLKYCAVILELLTGHGLTVKHLGNHA